MDGSDKLHARQINAADKAVVLPPKEDTYGNIEGLMNHFMLIMEGEGLKPPPGEIYIANEAANGELGFYMVSDGTGHAYACIAVPLLLPDAGHGQDDQSGMIADVIATFGTINMIAGELDR